MNTTKQQAELYRKAAETIEMCAEHGIEPMIKYYGDISPLVGWGFDCNFDVYEFPIAVIEGQLVWAGDKLYSLKSQGAAEFEFVVHSCNERGLWGKNGLGGTFDILSWKPSKQPLCEVEGKPVYKGDILYNPLGMGFVMDSLIPATIKAGGVFNLSWTKPKRTVMVELSVEDAEYFTTTSVLSDFTHRMNVACRKALDNLKGDKS